MFGGGIGWMENFEEKIGRETFLEFVWLCGEKRKYIMGSKCFLSKLTIKFSHQVSKNTLHVGILLQVAHMLASFFFFSFDFFFLCYVLASSFFFFLFFFPLIFFSLLLTNVLVFLFFDFFFLCYVLASSFFIFLFSFFL